MPVYTYRWLMRSAFFQNVLMVEESVVKAYRAIWRKLEGRLTTSDVLVARRGVGLVATFGSLARLLRIGRFVLASHLPTKTSIGRGFRKIVPHVPTYVLETAAIMIFPDINRITWNSTPSCSC